MDNDIYQPGNSEPQFTQPQFEQPQFTQPQYEQPQFTQPQYEQPQFTQPQYEQTYYEQPQYAQPQQTELSADIQERVERVFSNGLASIIMSNFPIACIIAIAKGNSALNEYVLLAELLNSMGIRLPGKLITGRILAIIGKVNGILGTVACGLIAIVYVLYFFLFFIAML